MDKKLRFETIQLHGGQTIDREAKSRAVPIYQTASYLFDDTEDAADIFALKKFGYAYSRTRNPVFEILGNRLAQLEGGLSTLVTSSGMAAITYAILGLAKAGDEIVASSTLYGGTVTLFNYTFKDLGINVKYFNPDNLDELRGVITDKTKAVFIETIGNPEINVSDIEEIANISHENKVPLIVDNTFATPYLCRPIEFGADIVVHSLTKFLGGHGTSIGGILIDSGKFNWDNGKFPQLTEAQDRFKGVKFYEQFGETAYITRTRNTLMSDIGACLSPFNGFLILQGIETLSLRMERHVENAKKIAEYLENHEKVAWVKYPALKTNKYHEIAKKYLPKGSGSIFAFGLKGGYEASKKLIESVEIFSHLANVGDAKSLIIHAASTTHQQLTEEEQIVAGVSPDLIRMSVGIENVDDLIEDLENALKNI
ncbi:O-acetylhomoserine (thiol)-lyase CysD [Gottschalkia acidurici 9a]|uniref:O-succinylhomoserine sulfhydrylase n=1 Tax=Gottschalkia acidurici (strain ATCC 7906 / DSM 604 / BCRC 14475 / CIP 104303 / KCTC 5404 / NCIMB 10678 / 9a) TaxID=1128398 RepID=K0AZH1_GOTA9|nr:O-acetylhomoserine aminocarboxypropyltransferase/cysteine synthase [Gottschalkia acidurici]AFS78182.1 O-acetylhomoserine (thiol)-lyase CysD [Gottschalkia acidurici 9a]